MADLKISALTAATTPLAGTEVLPIVQSGVTKQVSVDNLTAGKTVYAKNVDLTAGRLFLDQDYQITWRNGATNRGRIYIDSGNTIGFESGASNTTRMAIDSSGNTTISTGNVVIGTSGKGIDFSATAGTGTSELLADYEEGTFSPVVQGSSTAGTATYATQQGVYTKVGNLVTVTINLRYSAGTGTGNLQVGGLPFNPSADTISTIGTEDIALTASNYPICTAIAGTSRLEVAQIPVGGGGFSFAPYDAAGVIRISCTYRV